MSIKKEELTPEVLKELLHYDRYSGVLKWKTRSEKWFSCHRDQKAWNNKFAGKQAFTAKDKGGYSVGAIMGLNLKAHRVIYAIEFGQWPENDIDHVNGIRTDNRIENLRHVSRSENLINKQVHKNNTSGTMGVSWDRNHKKWQSLISTRHGRVHLGYFSEKEDAIKARKEAEMSNGYHINHGRLPL